ASAAVESVAENLTDALVAPVCFYLVFGLAGAAAYRAVNTADAMLGYRDGSLEWFGKLAARLDDVLNFVPARLAALGLVAGAVAAGEDARGALRMLRRDGALTASPNAGRTMAAMAGALGLTLGKRGAYRLGEGRPPTAGDVARAVRVFAWAAGLTLGALLLLDSLALFLRGGRGALGKNFPAMPEVARVEVAGPGFLNVFLAPAWTAATLHEILDAGAAYGLGTSHAGQRTRLEFVSANPTGPLVIVNARAAAVGD